jgi:hypothetical protein
MVGRFQNLEREFMAILIVLVALGILSLLGLASLGLVFYVALHTPEYGAAEHYDVAEGCDED